MNEYALTFIALLFIGCGTLNKARTEFNDIFKKEYTPVTNPDTKGRPIFYSTPQSGAYDDLGSISAEAKGGIAVSCETLADNAIDMLIEKAKKKGGHAAIVGKFSDCESNKRSGRTVSVDGIALLDVKLLPLKSARVGDLFFSHIAGDSRYDLTVIELTPDRLSLQYSEFFWSNNWLIKQGFNKTFTYSPNETIRFKGYEFEPISVTNGQFTYKRTK